MPYILQNDYKVLTRNISKKSGPKLLSAYQLGPYHFLSAESV